MLTNFGTLYYMIHYNNSLKLIFSDVDETIADLYLPAELEMIEELQKLLESGVKISMITGQSAKGVMWRVTDRIRPSLRKNIVISHCSGAEVVGFDDQGELEKKPLYSLYEKTLTQPQRDEWRKIVEQVVQEFQFNVHGVTPLAEFHEKTKGDPLSIMLEDRGPQITFEIINAYKLSGEQILEVQQKLPNVQVESDLRVALVKRLTELLVEKQIPITPRLAGEFAVDLAIQGVSKTTSVAFVLENPEVTEKFGLRNISPGEMEVWGDKFGKNGTDHHMSVALPKETRSITFRQQNPSDFPEGYNIVIWDGRQHLHHGLLEYLRSR